MKDAIAFAILLLVTIAYANANDRKFLKRHRGYPVLTKPLAKRNDTEESKDVFSEDSLFRANATNSLEDTEDVEDRSLTEKFINLIKNGRKKNQCLKTKADGKTPSTTNGDAPLHAFGYPNFQEGSRTMEVAAQAALSNIGGFKQPIRIGAKDYVIAGYKDELESFLECFKDYEVIGEELNEDGHWYKNTGHVHMQLNNLDPNAPNMNEELWEMMFSIGMDKIIKFLNPSEIIGGFEKQLLGSSDALSTVSKLNDALEKVKDKLFGSDKMAKKVKDKIIELYKGSKFVGEKVKTFIEWYKEESRKDAIKDKWVKVDNVDKDRKLLLTLTMYTKPEHGVRATYDTGRSTVSLAELKKALQLFLGS